jgi:hypothetical protein
MKDPTEWMEDSVYMDDETLSETAAAMGPTLLRRDEALRAALAAIPGAQLP